MNNSILFEKMTESHDMLLETIRHFIACAMADLAVTSFTYLEHVWRLWLMYSKRTTPWSQFSDISQCNWQLVNQSADWQQLKRGGTLHPLTFTRQGLCQRADLSLTQDRDWDTSAGTRDCLGSLAFLYWLLLQVVFIFLWSCHLNWIQLWMFKSVPGAGLWCTQRRRSILSVR